MSIMTLVLGVCDLAVKAEEADSLVMIARIGGFGD